MRIAPTGADASTRSEPLPPSPPFVMSYARNPLVALGTAFTMLMMLDAGTTVYALNHGLAREGNAFAAWLYTHDALAVVKAGATLLILTVCWMMREHRMTRWYLIGANAFMALININNIAQILW